MARVGERVVRDTLGLLSAAQEQLHELLPSDAGPSAPPASLRQASGSVESKYRQLQDDYAALERRHHECMAAWVGFRDWWLESLATQDARRRTPPHGGVLRADVQRMTQGIAPPSLEVQQTPSIPPHVPDSSQSSSTEKTSQQSAGRTRRNRRHILRHRARVRKMLRDDPRLFKGLGRYSAGA